MAVDINNLTGTLLNRALGMARQQYKITHGFWDIYQGPLQMKSDEYSGEEWYEVPNLTAVPVPLAAGAPDQDYNEAGVRTKFYPKDLFGTLEVGWDLARTKTNIKGLTSVVANKVTRFLNLDLPWYMNSAICLDGSGRRAEVTHVVADSGEGDSTSRLYLKPVHVPNTNPGFQDATKWIRDYMRIDTVSYTEGTTSDDSGSIIDSGLRIMRHSAGSAPAVDDTAHATYPYIDVYPAITSTVKGNFVCLINAESGVDGEIQGLMASVGNGYNSNEAIHSDYPRIGRQFYGQVNRQAYANSRLQGYCYNTDTNFIASGSEFDDITLDSVVMENFLEAYHDWAPEGTEIDFIITHWRIRQAYAMAHRDDHVTLFNYNPANPDIGYGKVTYHDPKSGKEIPIYGIHDWHRRVMMIVSKGPLAMGHVGEPSWQNITEGSGGPWHNMLPVTKEKLYRAVYGDRALLVNHFPSAIGVMYQCKENPTFS